MLGKLLVGLSVVAATPMAIWWGGATAAVSLVAGPAAAAGSASDIVIFVSSAAVMTATLLLCWAARQWLLHLEDDHERWFSRALLKLVSILPASRREGVRDVISEPRARMRIWTRVAAVQTMLLLFQIVLLVEILLMVLSAFGLLRLV